MFTFLTKEIGTKKVGVNLTEDRGTVALPRRREKNLTRK